MKNLIILFLFISSSFNAYSQNSLCEAVVVEGKSSVKMTPEIIAFNINFSVVDTNYNRCAELTFQKIESVKSQFIKNGIDKELIETNNYSIAEKYEYDQVSRKQVFKGYRASIPILIETEVENPLSKQIYNIIKNNLKSNFKIDFHLSQVQIDAIKEKLIELAIEDANLKAQLLAKNSKIKLGKISKIQYGEPRTISNFSRSNYELLNSYQPITRSSELKTGITVLNPAKIEMRTSVMIAWMIEY